LAEGRDPDTTPVYDVATHTPVTLHPEQPFDQVPQIMSYEAVRRLPVVKDGKVVGVISLGDLAIIHAKRVDGGSRQATAVLVDISRAEGPSLRQAELRETFGAGAPT
jgi:signal-transduction protein with cAMP-binding, CBS, and nucleotidyltransferase domain